jgi:hypothetical protein
LQGSLARALKVELTAADRQRLEAFRDALPEAATGE